MGLWNPSIKDSMIPQTMQSDQRQAAQITTISLSQENCFADCLPPFVSILTSPPFQRLCFGCWANYQLSAWIKAKKPRQVWISPLITTAGNKRRRWKQLMVDCFHPLLSNLDAAPVNLVTTPTELNFRGLLGLLLVTKYRRPETPGGA